MLAHLITDSHLLIGLVLAGPDREFPDELHLRIRWVKHISLSSSLCSLLLLFSHQISIQLKDVIRVASGRILLRLGLGLCLGMRLCSLLQKLLLLLLLHLLHLDVLLDCRQVLHCHLLLLLLLMMLNKKLLDLLFSQLSISQCF